jgi:segregation and condensation protein B
MSNLKYKLEALLFSSARSMKIEELSELAKASPEEVRETLNKLKEDYEERDSSITLIDEGNSFKLNVKSEHAPMVNQVVTETELSKTLMETLAVIAFKYPIKQSELIKIRTNKAYDHLRELEEVGYITRQKFGRTKLIKLTPKFFEYFDLPQEKLKEKFQDFGGIARAIKEKEEEIKQIKDDMKKKAKEEGKNKEQEPEVDLIDKEGNKEKLEVYEKTESEQEVEESKEVKPYVEKVGDLEVTDVPKKEEPEEDVEEDTEEDTGGIEMTESMGKEVIEKIKADITGEKPEEEKTTQEVESEVDKKVDELLHPKETEEESESQSEQQETPNETEEETSKEQPDSESKDSEEPKDLLDAQEEEKKE